MLGPHIAGHNIVGVDCLWGRNREPSTSADQQHRRHGAGRSGRGHADCDPYPNAGHRCHGGGAHGGYAGGYADANTHAYSDADRNAHTPADGYANAHCHANPAADRYSHAHPDSNANAATHGNAPANPDADADGHAATHRNAVATPVERDDQPGQAGGGQDRDRLQAPAPGSFSTLKARPVSSSPTIT